MWPRRTTMIEWHSTDCSRSRSSNAPIARDETPEALGVDRGGRPGWERIWDPPARGPLMSSGFPAVALAVRIGAGRLAGGCDGLSYSPRPAARVSGHGGRDAPGA